ncbi:MULTISPECIES: hypothetical protein [Paenibacillus]|uniref:Sugar ABC transporter permease n=1 Tax=Paenibacillus radicis (ex Xue et al. 2023) TaxID=2972489 RepID=A0ABT1YRV1_9BACL|nr:hypothetical protein [Paenibacillus radicis (ex Xue et al. 2023)]MCR8635901.1 hypothetical protein [Paenibacillus radicis (ex Xue et al. 2023)]
MELVKNTESKKQFSGLGLIILLGGLLTFLPFIYFMISWALGEVPNVAGGVTK